MPRGKVQSVVFTSLRVIAREPIRWVPFIALALLMVCYQHHRIQLIADSPYEAWDEIAAYNNSAFVTDPIKWRAFAYGSLDTAKMVLARWYYERMDPVGRSQHIKLYSNNVPSSWIDPKFDLRVLDWGKYSGIDFDHFRGVADRRPILIAREINLAFIYLLAACVILFAAKVLDGWAVPIFAGLAFCLSSVEFVRGSNYALPNGACTLLSFLIFVLCQIAICLNRPRLLCWAAVCLALGINQKIDFILLAFPLSIPIFLTAFWPSPSLLRFLKLAGQMCICFTAALIATNPYLLTQPRGAFRQQASVVSGLQGAADVQNNVAALWHFFGANFSFNPDLIPSRGTIVILVATLLTLSLLPLLLGYSLSWPQRIACLALVLALIAALIVVPIFRTSRIYERYFLNGWAGLLAGASCGFSIAIRSAPRSRRWTIVVLCIALAPVSWALGTRFYRIRETEFDVLSHTDPTYALSTRWSRNISTLRLLQEAKTGRFARSILIDQHANLDLRAFLLAGLNPVFINASNYQEVTRKLPEGQYLTIFTRGDPEPNPRWLGAWPYALRAKYDAYLDMLTRQPALWRSGGPLMSLLDWRPPQANDNMTLAVISVPVLASSSQELSTVQQSPPSAVFVQTDSATQGKWQRLYGSAGFAIANHAEKLPAFARVSLPGEKNTSTWADPVDESRALQRADNKGRIATTWYGFSPFTIDLMLSGNRPHRVAIYLVDWDSKGRTETIEVLNAVNERTLDVRQISRFSGGQYLVWNITGHVIIRVTPITGPNAVVSGLFLD
jgi:hypothetical protein